MTPGIKSAKRAKIKYELHPYDHDPNAASYGEEAAEKLGVAPEKVFKTLVIELDGSTLAVCVIPVTNQLDLKAAAKVLGAKKAKMADKNRVQRTTGYVLGGVSPLGQKKRLTTVIHESAQAHPAIYVSAGRRGLDIELAPEDLKNLTSGSFAHIAK
ncbi:MAG: Cys-tRNA(Pro) deacylase [Desulfobacteraceae bacterium]|nr:Cys-tRNA(Pro) deacylase [Desulfobacteraceae bacterium]